MVDQPNPGDIQPSFSISLAGDGFKNATRFDKGILCTPSLDIFVRTQVHAQQVSANLVSRKRDKSEGAQTFDNSPGR